MAENKGQIELPIIADLDPIMKALDDALAKIVKTTDTAGKKADDTEKKVSKIGETLKKSFDASMKGIDNITGNVFSKMTNTIRTSTENMKQSFSDKFGSITEKVKQIGINISTHLKDGIEKAKTFITTGVDKIKTKMKEIGTSAKEAGEKISALGTKLSLIATTPIILFGKKAFNEASDYAENMGKLEVVFDNLSDKVKSFTDTAFTNFGLSKNSASEMLSLYGDMGKAMGVPLDTVAEMSQSLTGLAGDLASFKNIEIDQAMNALKGVFTGETESLKNLGVVMTETTLQEYALSKGISKKMKDMTQAEKVALRYNYVMDMTTDAQGDFLRTSDGAANQTRIFQAAMENLQIMIGTKLLPIFTPLIVKANEMILKFSELSPEIHDKIIKIAGLVAVIGPLLVIGGKLTSLFGMIATAIGSLSLPIVGVIVGIGALFLAFKNDIGGIRTTTIETVKKMTDAFKERLPQIKEIFGNVMNGLKTFWNDNGAPVFEILGKMIQDIGEYAPQIFDFLLQAFSGTFTAISTIWNTVGKPVFDVFIQVVKWAWDVIVEAMPSILSVVSVVFQGISAVWNGILKPVLTALGNIFTNHIKPACDKVLPPLGALIQTLAGIIKWAFETIGKPAIDIFVGAIQILGQIASPILDGIAWAFDGITSAIGWAIDKLDKFLNLFRNNKGTIDEANSVSTQSVSVIPEYETDGIMPMSDTMEIGVRTRIGEAFSRLANINLPSFDFVDSTAKSDKKKVSANDIKGRGSNKTTIKTAIFLDKRQIAEAVAEDVDVKNSQYVEIETRRTGGRIAW